MFIFFPEKSTLVPLSSMNWVSLSEFSYQWCVLSFSTDQTGPIMKNFDLAGAG